MRRAQAELEVKQRQERSEAFKQLLQDFDEQVEPEVLEVDDQVSVSSTEVEECVPEQDTLPEAHHVLMTTSGENTRDDGTPVRLEAEPDLFLCDDWIMPVEVIRKPCPLQRSQDKLRARVAKNFLLVTLMSFECWLRILD